MIKVASYPLRKTSKQPKTVKVPRDDTENYHMLHYIDLVANFLFRINDGFIKRRILIIIFSIAQILCMLGHFGFTIYLLTKYAESSLAFFLVLCVVVIVSFFITFTSSLLNSKDPDISCVNWVITVIKTIYAFLVTATIIVLSTFNLTYSVVLIPIVIIAMDFGTILFIVCMLVFLFLWLFLLIEVCTRFILNLIKGSKYLKYSTYSYKESKNLANECVICLADYNSGDTVCLSKCERTHIFHEKCITEWITINAICPICRIRIVLIN